MGNIASPVMDASPLHTVKGLWGGELPEFDSVEAVNELVNALIGGLWNRLTEHQSRRNPFRLLRFDVPETREGLKQLALVRRQELDGFVEGLFGAQGEIGVPPRAHKALAALAEAGALLVGLLERLDDPGPTAGPTDFRDLLRNLQKLTLVAEAELNEIVVACTRARGELLAEMAPIAKPTLH
jgi:hypothetical protein